jgi:hypothetical protein
MKPGTRDKIEGKVLRSKMEDQGRNRSVGKLANMSG